MEKKEKRDDEMSENMNCTELMNPKVEWSFGSYKLPR
jgi:hypothetical protein